MPRVANSTFSFTNYDVRYYNVQHIRIFTFSRSAYPILCGELPNITGFPLSLVIKAFWECCSVVKSVSKELLQLTLASMCLRSSMNLGGVNLLKKLFSCVGRHLMYF